MVGMYQARRTRAHEVAAAEAAAAFSAYLACILRARRTAPRDDLLTHLLAVSGEGGLTPEEVVATAILLLNAGHEATVHTIGNGAAGLIRAGLWGGEITDGAVEEVLRHDPPLHLFTRYASEDVEIFGHHFARGDRVGLLLAAANRDPAAFPDPARFDPTRYPGAAPSVSFGAGLHFCLGAPLARIEIKIGLQALVRERPDLRLAERPAYADIYHFHGLDRLLVTSA
jgi:cytochrome P450